MAKVGRRTIQVSRLEVHAGCRRAGMRPCIRCIRRALKACESSAVGLFERVLGPRLAWPCGGVGHPRVTATSVTFAGRTQTCFALTPEISKKRLVWIARKTQLSATEMCVVVLGVEADVHRCKVDIAPSTLDWVRRRKASCPTQGAERVDRSHSQLSCAREVAHRACQELRRMRFRLVGHLRCSS
jgi:hypothetical protein